MPTRSIDGVLLDMNGLFRHWRNEGARESEQRAGLPAGTIGRYAYDHPNYRLARVGIWTDQQWADDVADRLADDFGPTVREHLGPWRTDRGHRVPEMIALLQRVRAHVPAGVLSNCTDALQSDLDHHGIEFDYVCSSASLGVDKPSPHAFRAAAEVMGIRPQRLAYCDDEPAFVAAAQYVGLRAARFTGAQDLVRQLQALGLPSASWNPAAEMTPPFRSDHSRQ